MGLKCSSGKTAYHSESLALEALEELWSRASFRKGEGPVTVYLCEECAQYHFTSKGTVHERLSDLLNSGRLDRLRESAKWEEKFKGR